jgi:hypothetical protein
MAASALILGVVLLGLGISGLHNEDMLARRGVPVAAQVSATHGYGRGTIQVAFPVATQMEHGTIHVGDSRYETGEPVLVVFDPRHPQVVGLAGHIGDTGSAWTEVVVGGIFLSLLPAAVLLSRLSARRRRLRAMPAGVGG